MAIKRQDLHAHTYPTVNWGSSTIQFWNASLAKQLQLSRKHDQLDICVSVLDCVTFADNTISSTCRSFSLPSLYKCSCSSLCLGFSVELSDNLFFKKYLFCQHRPFCIFINFTFNFLNITLYFISLHTLCHKTITCKLYIHTHF